MFRSRIAAAQAGPPADQARRALRRAALFGAALIVLWLVTQLASGPAPRPSVPVYADEAGAVARRPAVELASERSSGFRPGILVALLLLGGGVALAVQLHRRAPAPAPAAAELLRPLGRFQVAPNQHLHLVRCADEVLLLGVSAGQLSLLKSYPADRFEAAPSDTPAAPQAIAGEPAFAQLLRRYAEVVAQHKPSQN